MSGNYNEANEAFEMNTENFKADSNKGDTNADAIKSETAFSETYGGTPGNGTQPNNYGQGCCCRCCNNGELVKNGGMESTFNNRPRHWTAINSSGVKSENSCGNVHTGNDSVTINSCSGIEQRIDNIRSCTIYDFSFFAKGLTAAAGLTAKVIFVTGFCQVEGAEITIRPMDMLNDGRGYDYYRTLTAMSPRGTIAAIIRFTATGILGQKVNIDDVSFSTK